jgi:FGGY-family pentulose kinase
MTTDRFYIGIDVGTGSTRAGVFDATGKMLASATHPLQTWRPQTDFVEQSSDDIWRAVCTVVQMAVDDAAAKPENVRGIGFDATCSLVAIDSADQPVSVSPTGRDEQNVIVWMDHRATPEAELINALKHDVLRYVGGRVSPEMQSPKLLWLKKHLPESFKRTARFLDLPDFLTYRATGRDTRSLCTTVCKWTYQGHAEPPMPGSVGRWDETYWQQLALSELTAFQFAKIGSVVRPMGEAVGTGLSAKAAAELRLTPHTPVSVSIIDAHAGGIGVLGASVADGAPAKPDFETRIALIGGTSSCHMAVSREPRFIAGVWGPYYSAMVPGLWLTEGGQSATGALIDHVIFSHARGVELRSQLGEGRLVYNELNDRLAALAKAQRVEFPAALTRDLHVLPYFHGNRSPRADASLRGVIAGLSLDDSVDSLALLYLATIQAIAHGTKHIIDTLNAHGYRIDTILACGGGTKNPVFLREHADITGCKIILPREPEAVLLGSAILGAVAGGDFASVPAAMTAMSGAGQTIEPAGEAAVKFHAAKHEVFQRIYVDFMAYRGMMYSDQ